MTTGTDESRLRRRLVDTLYLEAMVLADEARGYFDEGGRADRDMLGAFARVTFSCESLKVTTRLMHIIAWLLTQRAVEAGELSPRQALEPSRRLGEAPPVDPDTLAALPNAARLLVAQSADLHRRVARLDAAQGADNSASPARDMQQRLALSF